jgi:hypothetical protein
MLRYPGPYGHDPTTVHAAHELPHPPVQAMVQLAAAHTTLSHPGFPFAMHSTHKDVAPPREIVLLVHAWSPSQTTVQACPAGQLIV